MSSNFSSNAVQSSSMTFDHFPSLTSAPLLPLRDRHPHESSQRTPFHMSSSRNFSIFPFSSSKTPLADDNHDNTSQGNSADDTPIDFPHTGDYTPDSIINVSTIAETAALDSAFEGAWLPTKALLWSLTSVHDFTGLPWWQSIMATTFFMRTMTFPVMLMQIKNTYKLSLARPEIEHLVEHLKQEQAKGNPNATNEYQQRVMAVWQKYDANPMKSMATLLVQAPLFIGFFSALRGLAAAKVPSLTEGGALWFSDLTVADPTYMLPIIASATFLLTVELGAADGMEGQTAVMQRRMKNIMRVVAVGIVPFTLSLPASVFMYWTTSNAFSLVQTLVMKIPGVKQALGIPVVAPGGGSSSLSGGSGGAPVVTYTHKPVAGGKKGPQKKK